ncbi:MAG: hypothetical protein H0T65_03875, partial [Deltaproteobacteria bacterium]|nr:hypothetical protein [Deltaproteobacteria bacterium]
QQPPGQGAYQSGPPGGGADPAPINAGPAPAPAPAPTAPAPRPLPPKGSNIPTAMQTLFDAHNAHRARHCAAPLAWSPKLAQAAQSWADALKAQGCKFGHKPRNPFGENLAAGTSGTLDGQAVADMWYDEVKLYKFPDGGFSMQTGHFTQVVWRQTTQIGCGVATCNGMDIFVCEYDPAGNVGTMYRQNVLPTGCR